MPVEFSDEALTSAQAGAKRLTNAKQTAINEQLDITKTPEYKAFCDAMDEDLNTSKALAVLFDLTTRANKDEKDAYTILYKLGTALGFTFEKAGLSEEDLKNAVTTVSKALNQTFNTMEDILELRKQARAEKNWEIADKIRISLDSIGIILKDTPDGTKIELK
jgi:cysteinyl-tRNA synthetase